jgi:hypothetical protein
MSTWDVTHLNVAVFMKSHVPLVRAPQRARRKMKITVMLHYVPGVITREDVVSFLIMFLILHLQNLKTHLNPFLHLLRTKPHFASPIPE